MLKTMFFIMFLLKLLDIIDYSWWVVFSPMILAFFLTVLVFFLGFVCERERGF